MTRASFLRVHEAAEAYGCSRSQFYVLIKCGLMVPPIRRGKAALWPADEIGIINVYMARQEEERRKTSSCACESCKRAPEEEIKALIARLILERSGGDPFDESEIAAALGIPCASSSSESRSDGCCR